jgi:uncharacterized protein
VIALAPVSYTLPDWPDVAPTLDRLGHYPIENTRTKQWMPVGRAFFADAPRHDPLAAARALAPRPLLVLHGDADTSVPIDCGRAIADAHGRAQFECVPGADHVFGATHPFRASTAALERVIECSVKFVASLRG